MIPGTITTRITYHDLRAMPDDGKQYEVIDGELYVNPSPITKHQIAVVNLSYAFQQYVRTHRGARSFVAPFDVVLADDVMVQPDVFVILSERESIIGPTHVEGPPHIVVEVLSESSRRKDEIIKRQIYDRFGVDEYWVVDPEIDLVKIYRRSGKSFVRVAEISTEAGGVITTPLLPAFELPIEDVFAV
jgi:Uma2 family endonuclease